MLRVLAALTVVGVANAHICMISPAQRGGYNISGPGNMACFQPTAPCGTAASADPAVTYNGGQQVTLMVQQNLNHYNVGDPGFIDIAFSKFPEPSSDDGFTTLRVLPDYWAHLQARQTNFSVSVQIPNVDCPHCVMRVRYHPNKPTEPIFHQCADIAIKATTTPPSADGTLLVLAGAPPATSKLYAAQPLRFGASGEVQSTVSSVDSGTYIADGLAAYVESLDTAFYVAGANTGVGNVPSTLLAYGKTATKHSIVDKTGSAVPGQIDAIVASGDPTNPLLMVGRIGNASEFFFYQVRYMSADGVVGDVLAQSDGQQTFVNFMWAANFDVANNKLYFAAGDENSLFKLNLVVFTADLSAGTLKCVLQDNSAYTLSSIHLNPADGQLYTMSPGLYNSDHSYTLVQVSPTTGAVTPIGVSAAAGKYAFDYAGGVYGSSIVDGSLVYMFTDAATNGQVLAHIDVSSGLLTRAVALDTGVNGQVLPVSPMYLPASTKLFA